jgi:hypothetical protein
VVAFCAAAKVSIEAEMRMLEAAGLLGSLRRRPSLSDLNGASGFWLSSGQRYLAYVTKACALAKRRGGTIKAVGSGLFGHLSDSDSNRPHAFCSEWTAREERSAAAAAFEDHFFCLRSSSSRIAQIIFSCASLCELITSEKLRGALN